MYRLRLFGGVSLEAEGRVVGGAAAQRHRLALLALLCVPEPRPVARDRLIALLWPESDTSRARNLLNQSIHTLRRVLGDDVIQSVGDSVALDAERIECDVHAFEAGRRGGDVEAAAALYTGAFLDGFFLKDAAEFEQWASAERDRLGRAYGETLSAAAEAHEAAAEWSAAGEWWRRAAQHDPLSSTVMLRLMRALAATGDRPAALRHAQVHAALVREELGSEPDPAILELEHALRQHAAGSTEAEPAAPSSRAEPVTVRPAAAASPRKRRRLAVLGAVAVTALSGAALLMPDRAPPIRTPADPGGPAPGVAVLPFAVNDPALATWREAIVVLLAIDLEGVPGLRPIASRTVLARWGDRGDDVPLQEALRVAREAGARFAVVGSANALGAEVVLSAELYDALAAERVAAVRVRGRPDSIFDLVNGLTLEIVRELSIAEGQLPRIDLASVTTRSVPALKAFLEGEASYRRGRYHAAMTAYREAVGLDTAFALGYARLANACSWAAPLSRECARWRAAGLAHADRLPDRTRAVLRGYSAQGLEALDQLVQLHPDDIEAWYMLGETYAHRGDELLTPRAAAATAFARAVALDSTFAPAYEHLILYALQDLDSARAATLMATHARVASEDPVRPILEFGFEMAFAPDSSRASTLRGMEHEETRVLVGVAVNVFRDASMLPLQEQILRAVRERSDAPAPLVAATLFENLRMSGRLREAREVLDDPRSALRTPVIHRYRLYRAGLREVASSLRAQPGDTPPARALGLLVEGIMAADQRDARRRNAARAALTDEAARRMDGDTLTARVFVGAAAALDGYAAWRNDSTAIAVARLQAVQREYRSAEDDDPMSLLNRLVRLWLGDVLAESDRPQDALRYLDSLYDDPYARFEAARIHERLGDREAARRGYQYALLAWRNADPQLRAMTEAAALALERLRD